MQVCILYAGKSRESDRLKAVSEALARGLAGNGHIADVVNMRTEEKRLTIYDYVIIGTEPVSFFSASVPGEIAKVLAAAGAVSGKRCMAFVTGSGLRKNKTLLNLMKAMEGEGMILKLSEVIKNPGEAQAIGKRLNVERNF